MVFVGNKFGYFVGFCKDLFLFVAMITKQGTILSLLKSCGTLQVLP